VTGTFGILRSRGRRPRTLSDLPASALVLLLTLAVVLAGACSSSDGGDGAGAADEAEAATDAAAEVEDEGTDPGGPFATGHRTMTLVDTSRPTEAVPGVLPAAPDRTIELDVVYPADGEPGPEPDPASEPGVPGAAVDDAEPADGDFPLVVFAHGFNGQADAFLGFAERWAREGYVVALPTFPLSREGVAYFADVANQPGDVSFVIDSLAGLDDDDPLAGRVDEEHVAVGGHSLGGVTVLGVGYNSCCVDERVDATIQVAGGPLPYDGGTYDDPPPTPMLLVHGVQDQVVPISVGDGMASFGEGPIWYLRPDEADHVTVFTGDPGRLFNEAALAFLDAELRDDDSLLEALPDEVAATGIADFRPPG
jgi:dienelactone hydrolase